MRWLIATPFNSSSSDRWLARFVTGDRHSFECVPSDYAHDRSRSQTSAAGWADYLRHARAVLRAIGRRRDGEPATGVVTCFPQLPTMLGLLASVRWSRPPIVAWSFNLGSLPSGLRRHFSRFALRRVALFVVHSRAEIDSCSRWLGFDRSRFVFVPLQAPQRETTVPEDDAAPFVLAMGTANRDYALLFDVVRELGMRTIVVSGAHAVQHLDKPANVEVRSGLTIEQCHELLQACRVSVVPVANAETASGQVTLLDSLGFGKATVVTDCPGSADYIVDGVTALAVRAGDRAQMRDAIARLWADKLLRDALSEAARQDVRARFSDVAMGRILGSICDAIERKSPVPALQ